MGSEIVIPQKSLFYRRYVNDIYIRKRKFKHDELFEKLNNYHPKIKLTFEVPQNFWIQGYILTMVSTTLKFVGKQQNDLHIGHRKYLKVANVIRYWGIYIDLIAYLQILVKK